MSQLTNPDGYMPNLPAPSEASQNLFKLAAYRPEYALLQSKFRYWHVEALLNQAADLIEKCVEEMKEYWALDFLWTRFELDLASQSEDTKLDRDYGLGAVDNATGNRSDGAWDRDGKTLERKIAFLRDSQANFDRTVAMAAHAHSQGGDMAMAGWARNDGDMHAKRIENAARTMDSEVTNDRKNWADKDKAHNEAKLDVRDSEVNLKKTWDQGRGLLVSAWQRDLVGRRLQRNYEDALDRARVAELGLRRIYGRVSDTDPDAPLPPLDADRDEAITRVAIWIRNAIEWLIAYQQREQAFTHVISIRALLGKDGWSDIQKAKDRVSVAFDVSSTFFENHDNVRIRSLAASLLGTAGRVPWSINIRLPKKGIYVRDGKPIAAEQSDLPGCVLGRVENRNSVRPIELCGGVSLMNASPICDEGAAEDGKWVLTINRPLGSEETFDLLDDVLLELGAVGLPAR